MSFVSLNNVESFDQMILSTSLLSNNSSIAWKNDSRKIIDFICQAYEISKRNQEKYSNIIIEEISNLCLIQEYIGLQELKEYDEEYTELDFYYDVKGRILKRIKGISEELSRRGNIHDFEFNYTNYTSYHAETRFNTILKTATYGNPLLTCQAGIMLATGIGINKDIETAILRFKQCAYWGYIPAIKYLAYSYKLLKDMDSYKIYSELYDICINELFNGVTLLPEEKAKKYSKDATTIFSFIASIYRDIVIGFEVPNINFSFLEVIFTDRISNDEKMKYINEYNRSEWKEVTNSTYKSFQNFGFKI